MSPSRQQSDCAARINVESSEINEDTWDVVGKQSDTRGFSLAFIFRSCSCSVSADKAAALASPKEAGREGGERKRECVQDCARTRDENEKETAGERERAKGSQRK